VIARLAAKQHGVVTRRQLVVAGLATSTIERRLASGLLVQLHRGVYAVGHGHLRREGHWLAAVLAVPGAVLSHRDAAGLHELRPANHPGVDVATTGRAGQHRGIRVHRTRVLDARDIVAIRGIPVTSLARTLVDLAGAVPSNHLASALREADDRLLLDARELQDAMARTKRRPGPGHRALREALAEHAALGATLTRSTLEDAFLRLVRHAGLPLPRTNVLVDGHEVDALWHEARLVVELDGWAFHRSKDAFQRDRAKGNALVRAGYVLLRFTHDDVTRRAEAVAAELREALTAARATMSSPWL
jgi:very-short-patch-repair endonuclease